MMRMWMRPFTFAAVLALGVAACEGGTTDPKAFDDTALRADAALVAADGMFQDLALMQGPTTWAGMGFAPEAVGIEIQGSRSFSKTVDFFDAAGNEQSGYDPETTASMHIVAHLTREVAHTFWSADIERHRDMTLTGLEGQETERSWNGTSNGEVERSRHLEDGAVRSYDMTTSAVITEVVRGVPRAENPYPKSGSITRTIHAVITIDGAVEVRDFVATITFNGTQFVKMIIDGVEYDVDLAERNVNRRFPRG
jgi:hypothetical protein